MHEAEPSKLGSALAAVALASFVHWGRVLWLGALLTAVALAGTRSLELDTRLSAMLPAHFPSVRALTELERRVGGESVVAIVVEGEDKNLLRAYAEALKPRLEALPSVRHVTLRRPRRWYQQHLLHLADEASLERFTLQLEDRVDWEIQRHNPLYFDLEGGEAPILDLGLASRGLLGSGGIAPDEWATDDAAYYEDSAPPRLLLMAHPEGAASDLSVAADLLRDVEGVVGSTRAENPELSVALTGRYKKQIDQKAQLERDLAIGSLFALAIVLGYLWVHFRGGWEIIRLGLPLAIGIAWTFGFAGAFYGAVNILTAFIGAILSGLGIDQGIHLLQCYYANRALGRTKEAAICSTFGLAGGPAVVASMTTALGFVVLALSDFRAFREFGVIAGVGMMAMSASFTCFLPALVRLLPDRQERETRGITGIARWSRSSVRWLMCAVAVLIALAAAAGNWRFNYDFAALQDARIPSFQLDREVDKVVGHPQSPVVILVESVQESAVIAEKLRKLASEPAGSTLGLIAGPGDVLGRDTPVRLELIERIRAALAKVRPRWLNQADEKATFEALLVMAAQPSPTRAALPEEVARQFGLSNRVSYNDGVALLAFPSVTHTDGRRVLDFAAALKSVAVDLPVAGEAMVFADILTVVGSDGPWILASSLAATFLALWLLRGWRRASVALVAALLSLLAGLGGLTLFGQGLNYLNIVVIPVLFGVAVDGAVHLLSHVRSRSMMQLSRVSIRASLLTSAFGFGGLLFADHPGLRSVAYFALAGLGANGLVSLVVLPAMLRRTWRTAEPAGVQPHRAVE